MQEMLIPASKVGLVIGRGGDTIKQLQVRRGGGVRVLKHLRHTCITFQERAGVKMMMIQDGPMPTGADKPLRISGDPYKVQVHKHPDLNPDLTSTLKPGPNQAI